MKITALTYPHQHFIDIAPLAARYEVLAWSVLTYLAAGQYKLMLRYSYKLLRLVKVYTRLDAQNILLRRKLEMLSHVPWRERVLRELGGLRRFASWEAARARILAQRNGVQQAHETSQPSWIYTPERLALSERLKAHVRKCARAGQSPLITRDRYKMDFEGQFRLPPLPRQKTGARQMKVYTQSSIVDYDFNPVPFGQFKGIGPAMVWPVEFYAAMEVDTNCHSGARSEPGRSIDCEAPSTMHAASRASASHCILRGKTQKVRNDRVKYRATPLHLSLDPKTYRYLFENPI